MACFIDFILNECIFAQTHQHLNRIDSSAGSILNLIISSPYID